MENTESASTSLARHDQIDDLRILVVEDDHRTALLIRKALRSEGFLTDVRGKGEAALATLRAAKFDIIVLDIMLPGRDGLSVLRQLRKQHDATPVLLLSARGEVDERVDGLNAGADDYLSKPFLIAELVARVRALGRRSRNTEPVLLRLANLTLDTVTREVRRGEKTIELTKREYLLLAYLIRTPGRVSGRMTIFEKVWNYDFDPGSNLVDVYISRLREKIDAGFESRLLHTVHGLGYTLAESP